MRERVLARRYAKALFQIGQERRILENICSEMAFMQENLKTNEDFRLFLYSQDINKKQKRDTIEKLFQDQISNVFCNFILVLLKKNREYIFETIAAEFERLVDRYNRKLRAATITALPMDEEVMSKLKKILDDSFNADVELSHQVDPAILGGVIVNVEGRILDNSLKSQLQRFKQQLMEKTNSR